MTDDGLLAAAWKDVGDTKAMYAFVLFVVLAHNINRILGSNTQVKLSRSYLDNCYALGTRQSHSV